MSSDRSANNDFSDNEELIKIFEAYARAYVTQYPQQQAPWPVFRDVTIYRPIKADNHIYIHENEVSNISTAVYFNPDLLLIGSPEERQKNGVLGKNTADRILDCAAYFLAQNIALKEIPDELRICLAVNHDKIHWTGIIAVIPCFKKFYQTYCYQTSFEYDNNETIQFNNAKNAISEKLGIVVDSSKGTVTPPQMTAEITLKWFKNIRITHYDSFDPKRDNYFKRVQDSLKMVKNLVKIENISCSRQQGNTCGDHTVANLFSVSMFNALPRINTKDSVSSAELRKLLEAIKGHPLENASALASALLTRFSNNNLLSSIQAEQKYEHDLLLDAISYYVQELSKLVPAGLVVGLVNSARSDQGVGPYLSSDNVQTQLEKNEEIKDHEPKENEEPKDREPEENEEPKDREPEENKEIKDREPGENEEPKYRERRITQIANRLENIFKANDKIFVELLPKLSELERLEKKPEQEKTEQERIKEKEINEEKILLGKFAGLIASDIAADIESKALKEKIPSKEIEKQSTFLGYNKKQFDDIKEKLHTACDRYLKHNEEELKKFPKKVAVLKKKLGELPQQNNDIPLSTKLYVQLQSEKNLDEISLAFIKNLAVKEIQTTLLEKNSALALKNCNTQLQKGKTLEILQINRQSLMEKILKILSIIIIFVGLGLVAKRLYNTGFTSINFFKPLTKNLHEDITKEMKKVSLPN